MSWLIFALLLVLNWLWFVRLVANDAIDKWCLLMITVPWLIKWELRIQLV